MGKYEDGFHMPQPETKVGMVGERILVESNLFGLDLADPQLPVFLYAVYFDSGDTTLEDRKLAVEKVQGQVGVTYAYDGTFLYLLEKLVNVVTKFKVPHPRQPEIVMGFKIMYRSKYKLGECQGLLKHLVGSLPGLLGCKPHHRVFYCPDVCRKVPDSDIEVFGAYRLHLAQAEVSPTVVIDVIHCLQRGRTIADVFTSFKGKREGGLVKLKNYCLGKFAADNINNVVVKIGDLCLEESCTVPSLKVWTKTHPDRKLLKRFKEECVSASSSCYSLLVNRNGLAPSATEKNFITRYTRVSPNVRMKGIHRFLEAACRNIECRRLLQPWQVSLQPSLLSVQARVLPPPTVKFGAEKCIQNSRLFWNPKEELPNEVFSKPVELRTWLLFCLESDALLAQELMASLYFESSKVGFQISRGRTETVRRKNSLPLVPCFAEKMIRKISSQTQFVIVILPQTSGTSESREIYSHLKKICVVSYSVVSQMINVNTLKSKSKKRAFIGGVLSGIACKLGASLWCVQVPLKEKVMFVGMDVWHGSNNEAFSVGALIFSLNTNLLKIYSSAMLHEWRQEIFNSIRDHFVLALKAFVEENEQLPDRIIIYRDGVHRREYQTLLLHELKQYMDAVDMLYAGRRPFISMVVVQKRVYERFFTKLEAGKYVNAPSGTIVDHDLTRSKCYDFFLNSMYRKKGTTIPTHYAMIYDNSNMSPDMLHEVTHSLCYSYFNWPGAFYVPAVIQYAHKLAAYVGRIGAVPPAALSKQLHFL